MGHDEETNNFNGGTTPVTPNPRAQFTSGNRLGMRPARDLSTAEELNRIVEAENRENLEAQGGDIVLAPAEKEPKDKKFYIIIVLAIVTILAFAIGFLAKNGGIGGIMGNASTEKTNDFAKWLLNGDGKVATTTKSNGTELTIADFSVDGDKVIYPLDFYNVSTYATKKDENIEHYFVELNNKYNALKTETANSDKAGDVEKLGKAILLLENNVNYLKIQRDIMAEYKKSEAAAKEYLRDRFDKDLGSEQYNLILKAQLGFYENSVSENALYASANCYNENTGGNFECIMRTNDAELISSIDLANSATAHNFRYMSSDSMIKILNKEIITLVKSIGGK